MKAPVGILLSVILLVVAIGLIASGGISYIFYGGMSFQILGFVILGLVFGYYAGRFHESVQNVPPPPPVEKMFCVYCGTENSSAEVLCKKCGKKLLRPV